MGNESLSVSCMSLVDNRLLVGTDGQGLKIYNSVKGQLEDYTINSAPMNFSDGKIHTSWKIRMITYGWDYFRKG